MPSNAKKPISKGELRVLVTSERQFLIYFFIFTLIGMPVLYIYAPYFPWEISRNIAVLVFVLLFALIILGRIFVPPKFAFKIEIFEIIVSIGAVFGIALSTGFIQSPLNFFYIIPIAFSFFLIGRRFGFLVLGIVVVLLGAELFLPELPSLLGGNFSALFPYIAFFISYMFGIVYATAIILFVSDTLRRLEAKRVEEQEQTKHLEEIVKHLQKLDQEKTDFITLIAHHFRTPLSKVKWALSEVLEEEGASLTQKQKSSLKQALNSNENLTALLQKILGVAKWELDRASYKNMDISKLVKQIVGEWQLFAKKQKVKLSYSVSESAMIQVNAEGIREVLSGVLENSILYNKQNGWVKVNVQKGQKNVRITFQDSGIGIPKDEQNLLFGAFFRAKNVKSLDGLHRGLSLFSAQKIIQGHKGKMSVQSKENVGTTVSIELPLS